MCVCVFMYIYMRAYLVLSAAPIAIPELSVHSSQPRENRACASERA